MEELNKRLDLVQAYLVAKGLAVDSKTPLPSRAEIALTLRGAREMLGLTQAQMAERLGASIASMSRWERGALGMRRPTWKFLLKLASEGRREPEKS